VGGVNSRERELPGSFTEDMVLHLEEKRKRGEGERGNGERMGENGSGDIRHSGV